jgi:hypothetical protein
MISAEGPDGAIDYGCAAQVFGTAYRRTYGHLTRGVLFADYTTPSRIHQDLFPQIAALARESGAPPAKFVRINEKAAVQGGPGDAEVIDYEWDRFPEGAPVRWRSVALVITSDLGGGTLSYYISGVHAPAAVFGRDVRQLLRVWDSCRISARTQARRLSEAARSLEAAGRLLADASETQSRSFDRCLRSWGAAFREETIARDNETGIVSPGRAAGGVDFARVLDAANQGAGWKRFEILDPKEVE